jgi:hypothetical protein
VFNKLTVRGHRGALLWGAGDAARVGAWSATRPERGRAWTLRASLTWSDSYRLKQLPLMFTAPRASRPAGLWCFPVIPNSVRITERALTAQLGQPEG